MDAQKLMESQMGMQLSEMRRHAQDGCLRQGRDNLPGAHMPALGFYLQTNRQPVNIV